MRAHLLALKAALEPLGYPVHLFHAPPPDGTVDVVPSVPFLVLRGAWGSPDEIPACDRTTSLDTRVRITGTASTAEGALVVLERVRRLLSPHASWSPLQVTGRTAYVKFGDVETVPQVDRDLRLPNSNRHPGYGVDSYLVHSEPI